MDLSSKPVKKGHLDEKEDGRLVIVNDERVEFYVNNFTAYIWQSCDGKASVNQIVNNTLDQMQIKQQEREKVKTDIVDGIEQLVKADLAKNG